MTLDEEFKVFLPKYLSPEKYEQLLAELKSFPENIDKRMYSELDGDVIYQGDVIKDLPVIDISNLALGVKKKNSLIISNTCDIDLNNKRKHVGGLLYAPLVELEIYISYLQRSGISIDAIRSHIDDIRKQKVTYIFYLPGTGIIKDSIVFFDKVLNIENRIISREDLGETRLLSLSDYGFYLLLFKLSVHFSRMQEGIIRG